MESLTIEQRVAELEQEVGRIKNELARLTDRDGNWLSRISGGMKDNPAFREAMRLGAEIRHADRPED